MTRNMFWKEARKTSCPEEKILHLLWVAKGRAKRKGIRCTMQWEDLLPAPYVCPVLGIKLDYAIKGGPGCRRPNSPSIDRINPRRGYVPGNVRVISWRANSLKNNATPRELELLANDAVFS